MLQLKEKHKSQTTAYTCYQVTCLPNKVSHTQRSILAVLVQFKEVGSMFPETPPASRASPP